MNWIGVASRLAAAPGGPTLAPEACTHSRDVASRCEACVRACPWSALRIERTITLDATLCTACGACLHVCPVDAIGGEDHVADLLACAARLPDAKRLDVACSRHLSPATASSATDAVLQVPACLAALGPSAYLSLFAMGVEAVGVRVDACAACPISASRPRIDAAVGAARALLAPDAASRLTLVETLAPTSATRPVYGVKNPPVSRRALFRLFATEAPRLAARALLPIESQAPAQRQPPRERRRLLNALRLAPAPAEASAVSGFAQLLADEHCTACGVCARACPTTALTFSTTDEAFRLDFQPAACTDCGICLDVCEPDALHRAGSPSLAAIVGAATVTLREGALRRCRKCSVQFAAKGDEDLCPVCEYRRRNPFGSRLPPGVVARGGPSEGDEPPSQG